MTEHPPFWHFQSTLPGAAWPAISSGETGAVLGLLFQLESSQWLPAEQLAEQQLRQLDVLLKHAHATTAHYRESWSGAYDPALPLTQERFAGLPLLTRRDLQERYEAMKSRDLPGAHGATYEKRTSGSTGAPVSVLKTQLVNLFWNTFTLRDHLWHRRDLRRKLAAVRHGVTEGEFEGWGPATSGLVATGPSAVLGIRAGADAQLKWLEQQQPDYLMTYPSIAGELARRSIERGVRLAPLCEVRTFGELLAPETRELCRQAWGVSVIDAYSSEETGYIALQCPRHEHYHVQSEGVLVEVLDDGGRLCAPGEIGRIVVTDLHNFATPLIRYELGDYAEAGAPCPCGRGLPVLRRIMGRVRNLLTTASGERFWPATGARRYAEIAPVLQHQLVQKEFDLVEARLVTASPLTAGQESSLRQLILSGLPPGFRLSFAYCDDIPRSAGGKYEDFISEVTQRRQ